MNVKNLFYKEMKLFLLPATLLFALLSIMVMVPNYPYGVALLYFYFPVQICFQFARENKDLEFNVLLPVTRKEIVIAKHLAVAFIQLIQVVIAAIFAVISILFVNKNGNAMLDSNFTFFGIILIGYALFNVIFFTIHYKTGRNLAKPLLLGILAFILWITAMEFFIAFIPSVNGVLDGVGGNFLWARLLVLLAGAAVFAGGMALSIKISSKSFERVSL